MSPKQQHCKCEICGLYFLEDVLQSHKQYCSKKFVKNKITKKQKNEDTRIDNDEGVSSSGSDSFYSLGEDKVANSNSTSTSTMSESSKMGTEFSLENDFQNRQLTTDESHQPENSSLVTETFRYDRQKPKNLFPPTKKFRYYPITCDYCGKRYQPNVLKDHQKKHHLSGTDEVKPTVRVKSPTIKMGHKAETPSPKSGSFGGIPKHLRTCYICGQLYGSKSIKIHEPKCLDKWRIQNEQLPPELRASEPVKPEPIPGASGQKDYDLPEYDQAAEAAFKSHLKTLIPCKYCLRTFSPGRIEKHMSCCIEKPKTRQYTEIDEIPR